MPVSDDKLFRSQVQHTLALLSTSKDVSANVSQAVADQAVLNASFSPRRHRGLTCRHASLRWALPWPFLRRHAPASIERATSAISNAYDTVEFLIVSRKGTDRARLLQTGVGQRFPLQKAFTGRRLTSRASKCQRPLQRARIVLAIPTQRLRAKPARQEHSGLRRPASPPLQRIWARNS